jgi:hypothetical protein
MALIQVLALDKYSHRSEEGLQSELQGTPLSTKTWTLVAEAHPEFFRVKSDSKHSTSLVARHVSPDRTLSAEFTGTLINAAVEIHDRQVRRSERWTYLVPIWVALIAGVLSLIGFVLKALLGDS